MIRTKTQVIKYITNKSDLNSFHYTKRAKIIIIFNVYFIYGIRQRNFENIKICEYYSMNGKWKTGLLSLEIHYSHITTMPYSQYVLSSIVVNEARRWFDKLCVVKNMRKVIWERYALPLYKQKVVPLSIMIVWVDTQQQQKQKGICIHAWRSCLHIDQFYIGASCFEYERI